MQDPENEKKMREYMEKISQGDFLEWGLELNHLPL